MTDRNPKILVVDDEHLVRWFIDRTFRRSGHEVITAENVQEALAKLSSEAVDLIITDLRMPGQNGTELIGKADIRGKIPQVIVCSAFVTSELKEELDQKGIRVIKKPFMLDELNDAIKSCLGQDVSRSTSGT